VSERRTFRQVSGRLRPGFHRRPDDVRLPGQPARDARASYREQLLCNSCRAESAALALQVTRSLAGECLTSLLDGLDRQLLDLRFGDCHQQPTTSLQPDRHRGRFDFYPAIMPANLKLSAWAQPRLASDLLWDNEPPGSINGCFHGTDRTTFSREYCRLELVQQAAGRRPLRSDRRCERSRARTDWRLCLACGRRPLRDS